jgi:hypothetical protein
VRSLLATGAVLAAVAALTAGSVSARPAGTAVHKPTATITFAAEVTVKGKYFKKREKLTITLSSTTISQKWTKKATATKTGTFTASFGHIALSSCNQYTLKVVGSLKSRFTTSHDVVPC